MATTISEPISAPSFQELHQALISFVTTASGVAHVRSAKYGPRRFTLLSQSLARFFVEQFSNNRENSLISDFDEQSKLALAAIYEELIYISKRYEACSAELELNTVVPGVVSEYECEKGDPFNQDAVNEINLVMERLYFFQNQLPKPVRRNLETIMEVLKISRGKN